jgi:uncharacterized protein
MLDYLSLINKYYPVGTRTHKIYLIHVVLVTNKALQIARGLQLDPATQEFIEEASMLHDIGVREVDSPKMDCTGQLPYIAHGVAGGKILRAENLPTHALVAERHVGVGLSRQEIAARQLPLPAQDFMPESLPERIITYADLFFSKREPTLWQEDTADAVAAELAEYGAEQVAIFRRWHREFTAKSSQNRTK